MGGGGLTVMRALMQNYKCSLYGLTWKITIFPDIWEIACMRKHKQCVPGVPPHAPLGAPGYEARA